MVFRPSLSIGQVHSFGLSYCLSQGYLFGLFTLISYRRWLVILLMLGDLFILQLFFRFYWLFFRKNLLSYTSFSFIIGGFLGNFFDCIVFKAVRDFIKVPFFRATNLADIFLFLGLLFLLIELWINREIRKKMFKLKPLKQEWEFLFPLFKLPIEDIKKLLTKIF